jgi:selenocysteine-specific elongation factor
VVVAELSRRIEAAVAAFHAAHPLDAGMGREALRGKLPPVVDPRLFAKVLSLAAEKGGLAVEGDVVKKRGHVAAAAGAASALRDRVAALLAQAGITPPWLTELPAAAGASTADVQSVLKLLLAENRVVRVSAELWCDAAAVAGVRERLVAFLRERKGITTQEFKDLVGATRKHVIPLAEYFDREKVTLRVGEKRVLRGEQP